MDNNFPTPTPQDQAPQYQAPQAPQDQAPPYQPPQDQTPQYQPPQAPGYPGQTPYRTGGTGGKKRIGLIVGIIACAVVLAAVLFAVFGGIGNKPETPLTKVESAVNKKDAVGLVKDAFNGLSSKNVNVLYKLINKIKVQDKTVKEYQEELFETVEDQYGKNWKLKIVTENKDKMDKEDLEEAQEELREAFKRLSAMDVSEYSDYFKQIGSYIGLSEKEVKQLFEAAVGVGKDLKYLKVTDGYKVDFVVKITGKKLDKPEEHDASLHMIKVNDRWVCYELFRLIPSAAGSLSSGRMPSLSGLSDLL